MKTLISRVNRLLDRRTKIQFGGSMAVSVVLALMDSLAVLLMLPLVDLATGVPPSSGLSRTLSALFGNPEHKSLVVYVAILTIGLFVVKDLGSLAFTWWQAGFNARNRVRTSTQIMEHLLASPYTEVSRRSTSEMMRTMNDAVGQVYGYIVGGLMTVVIQGMTLLGIMAALLISAPLPTAALIVYIGAAALVYLRFMKPKSQRAGRASAEASRVGYKAAFAALGGVKELQVRGSQNIFVRRYRRASEQAIRPGQIASFINSAPKYLLEILFISAVGVLLVSTVLTKPEGPADGTVVGLLATFVAGGFRALPSITSLLGAISGIRYAEKHLDLVEEETSKMVEDRCEVEAQVKTRPISFAHNIQINDLCFSYPGSAHPALDGVSLTLPFGESLALAGSSGAGKTTLVDTLLGLHHPDAGSIRVDGVDIHTNLSGWQANIGYVPQEVFLLEATLAENIAFDQSAIEIDQEKLLRAIEAAQLSDVVHSLVEGVDTYIGERGSRLSGGQRQRVGIARALYREPSILVLDEATSALDNETEHQITQAISGLRGSVTVIIVAHRLSTARHATQLAFMKDGKVAAMGTFDEVRAANPEFANLVALGTLE